MTEITITDIEHYLQIIEPIRLENNEYLLFRGQSNDDPLLPGIARKKPNFNTSGKERIMLDHLKRVGFLKLNNQNLDIWDLLILAQHHGMQARLLDWSSNPLVALWFAVQNVYRYKQDSYVYILSADSNMAIDKYENKDPFSLNQTFILKPTLNNERIIGQYGWFTIHNYSADVGRFVALNENINTSDKITKIIIPSDLKLTLLNRLTLMGVNAKSIFPDLEGYCKHINWKYLDRV